jgi:hypothetical protein
MLASLTGELPFVLRLAWLLGWWFWLVPVLVGLRCALASCSVSVASICSPMCWRISGLAAFVHLTISCFVQSLLAVMCAVTLQSVDKFEFGLLAHNRWYRGLRALAHFQGWCVVLLCCSFGYIVLLVWASWASCCLLANTRRAAPLFGVVCCRLVIVCARWASGFAPTPTPRGK